MNIPANNLQRQMEIERLWVATEQGRYVFFNMMPISILIVAGLWRSTDSSLLLIWLAALTTVNLFRWLVLDRYRKDKALLAANVGRFKSYILLGAAANAFCWIMSQALFLDTANPANVLIITVPTITEVVGAMLTWFSYFPAVVSISIPVAVSIVWLLLAQGGSQYWAVCVIFAILPVLSATSSQKLAGMLNYALRLNFENAALRRESEEKSLLLETALENMAQGISMSDAEDRLRMWNSEFSRLLGSASPLVRAGAPLSDLLRAADPPLSIADVATQRYYLPDGRVYEVRQSALERGGRVVTYADISALIRREQALEKAHKEAEQANAAKTRFLASASHDLRQPIHALGLFFAELSERVHNDANAKLLSQIEDSIGAINSMLNALLDVSKLDAGVVKPDISACPLNELFHRLGEEFRPIALENRNSLKIRQSDYRVATDPAMLERILRNLIGNALQHSERSRVLVAARYRAGNVQIRVMDTGRGIAADQLDEIFVEFHQLNNPARDRRQGLGLGLAIVKRLANLLHHPLTVTSAPGRGSCFQITVPVSQPKQASPTEARSVAIAEPRWQLQGRRIMVIDDDLSVRDGMQSLLSHWGCRVLTAGSQPEAIARLTEEAAALDLLIVDYRLSDHSSGIDVARELQRRLNYRFGILIVTGDTGPERLREADASGFPLLHKPVQPAKLRSTLQYLLGKRHQTSASV